MGCHPSQLTFTFFRGVAQPPTSNFNRQIASHLEMGHGFAVWKADFIELDRWAASTRSSMLCGFFLGEGRFFFFL